MKEKTREEIDAAFRGMRKDKKYLEMTEKMMAAKPAPAQSDAPSAEEFYKTYPHCIGYPKCDGDLVGIEHSEECPLKETERVSMFAFAEAYAALRTAQLEKDHNDLLECYREREKLWETETAKVAQLERERDADKLKWFEEVSALNDRERASQAKLAAAESALSEARERAIQDVLEICRNERVDEEATREESDQAYNCALEEVAKQTRKLLPSSASGAAGKGGADGKV